MLDKVVKDEIEKTFVQPQAIDKHEKTKQKIISKEKQIAAGYKGRSKKERAHIQRQKDQKYEKKVRNDWNQLKKFHKDHVKNEERLAERALGKRKWKEMINNEEENGVVRKRRVGGYEYQMRDQEFAAEDGLKDRIRKVPASTNLIREAFDNYLRRGIIDPINPCKPVERRKMPKFKFHNVDREFKPEKEEELQEFM